MQNARHGKMVFKGKIKLPNQLQDLNSAYLRTQYPSLTELANVIYERSEIFKNNILKNYA